MASIHQKVREFGLETFLIRLDEQQEAMKRQQTPRGHLMALNIRRASNHKLYLVVGNMRGDLQKPKLPRVRRKLATVLAADVANYSAMVAVSEEETIRALKLARRTFTRLIIDHNGRIANTAGDSIIAVFESPVEAVRCSIEAQTVLNAQPDRQSSRHGKMPRVRFRIGIHLGDILLDGKDVLGDAVNVAARLESIATPGAICISTVIKDQIGNRFQEHPIADLGDKELKNIPQPMRVYELLSEKGRVKAEKPHELHLRRLLVSVAAVCIIAGAVGLGVMAAQSLRVALLAKNMVASSIESTAENHPEGSENGGND